MNTLIIIALALVPTFFGIYFGASYLFRKAIGKSHARNFSVFAFRLAVNELDAEYALRTGSSYGRLVDRLPPYESMLTDGLPLELESYFTDSEIRQLRGSQMQGMP